MLRNAFLLLVFTGIVIFILTVITYCFIPEIKLLENIMGGSLLCSGLSCVGFYISDAIEERKKGL